MDRREGREVNAHTEELACDQWLLRTSVKYDREPSKSTWQAHGQIQDFTSDEKNEPTAAQTEVHFRFWLVTLTGGDRWTDSQVKRAAFLFRDDKELKGFKWHLLSSCEGCVDCVAVNASLQYCSMLMTKKGVACFLYRRWKNMMWAGSWVAPPEIFHQGGQMGPLKSFEVPHQTKSHN